MLFVVADRTEPLFFIRAGRVPKMFDMTIYFMRVSVIHDSILGKTILINLKDVCRPILKVIS